MLGNFVLHVELCAAASCPLHVEVVNSKFNRRDAILSAAFADQA